MSEEAWKAWLEEKGELLETLTKWKAAALLYRDASNAWEARARSLEREAANYREACYKLQEIVESLLPEKPIRKRANH